MTLLEKPWLSQNTHLEREELLLALLNTVSAGICICNEEGRYVLVNQAYCQIYGYRPEELIGQPFLITLPPESHMAVCKLHHDFFTGIPYPTTEWLARRKDGANLIVQLINSLLVQDDGTRFRVEVVQEITERKHVEHEREHILARLYAQANTDTLTGLHSRRAFLVIAEHEFQRIQRFHHPLALVLLDIDHFKSVNDTYGHAVGDEVLRAVALRCRRHLRAMDAMGRWGGEEFVMLLPETDGRGALVVAERLRLCIAEDPIMTSCGPVPVTASFGVAATRKSDAEVMEMFNRADVALYEAKRTGRNRVVAASRR